MTDRIRLEREELYSPAVDQALETRRVLVARAAPEVEEISGLRRVLMSPMVYLTFAGFLAALLAWLLLEPGFEDFSVIGGEVALVETDPFLRNWQFPSSMGQVSSLTVGRRRVFVLSRLTVFERGADGQPPLGDVSRIEPGTFVEVVGDPPENDGNTLIAYAVRPATRKRAAATGQTIQPGVAAAQILLFPLTALLVAVFLLLAEGVASRNWTRTVERVLLGGLLTIVFAFLAYIPAGIFMFIAGTIAEESESFGVEGLSGPSMLGLTACRSAAWATIGAALGLGMNLVRTTKVQLRNAVVGGLLGGALGGLFFDPIVRFFGTDSRFEGAEASRIVGLLAVGTCVGIFVALVERLAREAWLRVRTGPLAGKAFVLYKSPTHVGSAPQADIYLFKDAGIDPAHAAIHRVGNRFEIEDLRSRGGTIVAGEVVRRRRLQAGDTIRLGDTVLEFEERAARSAGGEGGRR